MGYAHGPMKRRTPSLIFVFCTLLLDVLGFGLLIPVAPRLVAHVQGLPHVGAEHNVSWAVGLLAAIYAGMQFLFAPLLGSLSDRFGRRPVLLTALFGSAVDYFVMAMAPNLAVLYITRAINGISGATVPVCSAYIADVTPPAKRAGAFGIIGAAFGLGFVIGPLIGGILGDEHRVLPIIGHGDITYPYIAAGILTSLNWLFGLLVVPESLPRENRRAFSWGKSNPLGALKWLSGHRVVIWLAVTLFLLNVAQFGLHVTWVISMDNRFAWTTTQVGWSLFVVGLSAAIVQGGLARKVIPALGERVCLVGGLCIGVFAFLGYGLATEGWMIYTIIAVASIGGLAGPAAQGITSKAVGPREQGLLQGALASLQSIAGVIGPLVATRVFRAFTPESGPAQYPGAGSPFLLGSFLTLISLVPVLFVWRRMPTQVSERPDESEHHAPSDGSPAHPAAAASEPALTPDSP